MLDSQALMGGVSQAISCGGGKPVLGSPWANVDVSNPNATQQALIGCPTYFCETANQIQCNTEAMMILGAGALALLLLPGLTKILALAAVPISFGVGLCGSGL
jgi:hypothetical protein